MCGIAGFWSRTLFENGHASDTLTRMTDRLAHRGPDAQGHWIDADAGIALGHRRLAVVELSDAGCQPMLSHSKRYVLVFNGEIYNHLALREALGELRWRGHSDTETLLTCVEAWGLERALRAAVGMFALALWDRHERRLELARDRLGEKPLYYGWDKNGFVFASELKALRAFHGFSPVIDREALESLIRVGYVTGPRCIYDGFQKLQPGRIASLMPGAHRPEVVQTPYWSLAEVVARGSDEPFLGSAHEAVDELERLVRAAVRGQMMSDVPLGAFLSGGIDSSTVVAMMQAASPRSVNTYSIGFTEPRYDEAPYARAVAQHLGTEHTEWYVTPTDALAVIPRLGNLYDEPFADMSQIPTTLVSTLARREVTVALSGDAGDELFCGYGRYPQALRQWQQLSRVPAPLRRLASRVLPKGKLRAGIGVRSVDEFYRFLNTQWKEYPEIVLGRDSARGQWRRPDARIGAYPMERMMRSDMEDYLPDDILVKVDRAAMSVSLETRVPLLDHRIVEFAWSLPLSIKYRDGVGKWPLRQLLQRYVPLSLIDRPKMGFGVPMETWLRGPLREWAEDLLSADRLRREGYFAVEDVRREWETHLSGKRDRQYGLWSVLMFEAWLQAQQ